MSQSEAAPRLPAELLEQLGRVGPAPSVYLTVDQGGNHVRVRVYRAGEGWEVPPEAWSSSGDAELKLGGVTREEGFWGVLEAVTGEVRSRLRPSQVRASLAFAGPVSPGRDEVEITNWEGQPVLRLPALREALQGASVLMLNDVEAAAYGLLALEAMGWQAEVRELTPEGLGRAARDADREALRRGNKAILVPGTGLGTAGIHVLRRPPAPGGTAGDELWSEPMPSEVQHARAPAVTEREGALLRWLREHRTGGADPGHEDVASGQGLVDAYRFLAGLSPDDPLPDALSGGETARRPDPAALIAEAALRGDERAREALDLYYAYIGRVAQSLALALKAYGGVYVGGDTTAHNWSYIPRSPLLTAFRRIHKMEGLMEQFPVYLVNRPDLNHLGALYAASERWDLLAARDQSSS